MSVAGAVVLVCILGAIFGINVPLGRARARFAKFSWQWFVLVHASIPLIILMRLASGFGFVIVPLEVASAIGGQIVGGRLG